MKDSDLIYRIPNGDGFPVDRVLTALEKKKRSSLCLLVAAGRTVPSGPMRLWDCARGGIWLETWWGEHTILVSNLRQVRCLRKLEFSFPELS